MFRHLLILPDGTELFSGVGSANALQSVTITQQVNDGVELMPGSACAACIQARVLTPNGGLHLGAGDVVRVYRVDEENIRHPMGPFRLEKPTKSSAHTMTLTGFDAVADLDKDLTRWLADLDQWPYSAAEFSHMVCSACGLEMETEELPNGDFSIRPFTAEAVTGRKLIQWLGQLTGRFCRATPRGTLVFAWYAPNTSLSVAPEEKPGATWYFQNSLSYEDYQVAKAEKVQLRQNAQDVGTVWPDEPGVKNTYVIENNPMLAAVDAAALLPVAQTLWEQMRHVTYTPGKVTIPATMQIHAGDILSVTDGNGQEIAMYVMKKTSDGQTDTLECTGSHRRDSSSAVNNTGYRALSGKVLNLRTDVDGLKVENKNTAGKLAAVEMDLDGIRGTVENQRRDIQDARRNTSTLVQRADALELSLTAIVENGTGKVQTSAGYTFDDQGLHISRSDAQMENTLDHTGMYVRRLGEVILQANAEGVRATDVTVRNYLVVGDNARLEDFETGRTACFYMG